MEITRTLGTYSQMYWLLYLLTAVAGLVCARGVQRQVQRWRLGQGKVQDRLDRPLHRFLALAVDLLTQRRFRRSHHPWHFHAFIVWGFALFFLATLCVMLQEHFGLPTFSGGWYLRTEARSRSLRPPGAGRSQPPLPGAAGGRNRWN